MKYTIDITNKELLTYLKSKDSAEEEIIDLLSLAYQIIKRTGLDNDLDAVKKSIIENINNSVISVSNVFDKLSIDTTANIENTITKYFDPTLEASYLGKTISYLRESLSNIKSQMNDTVKLMLENAKNVSTDKLNEIENSLGNVKDKLNPEDSDSYLFKLKIHIDNIKSDITKMLDEENTASFAFSLKNNTERLFGEKSPLIEIFNSEMKKYVSEFRNELEILNSNISKNIGQDSMIDKTAQLKGKLFEDYLENTISNFSAIRGDVFERTGDSSVLGGKKGDFVYSFNESKIVIEAKDTKVTINSMLKYLDEAMSTRSAEMAILVVADESLLPKSVGIFNIYEGNKVFCVAEFIDFAIRFSKLLIENKSKNVKGSQIDLKVIETSLDTISNKMRLFSNIKTKLTKINKGISDTVKEVTIDLDNIKSSLTMELGKIQNMLKVDNSFVVDNNTESNVDYEDDEDDLKDL